MPAYRVSTQPPGHDLFGERPAKPVEIHRLFFAVLPGDAVRKRIAQIATALGTSHRARWIDPARYHLTLHFLGDHADLPRSLVEGAMTAARNVRSRAFDCVLDSASSFRGTRPPCVLRCTHPPAALQGFWDDLRKALLLDRQRVDRCFTPHVTLGYGHDALEPLAVEPVTWSVEGFALVHSRIGQGGPYEILGQWSLSPGGPREPA